MTRGITKDDVWVAADAVLLQGQRPTIERVRQQLGRGSPNTVNLHLDTWFKHLGTRIADPGAFATPPDIAEPVLQAAKHLWGMAQAETRRDFDQRLSEGMAAAIANVVAEKERAAQSDAAAFEATNRLTHAQTQIAEHLVIIETERLARATALADLANARQTVATLEARIAHNEEVLAAERAQHRSAVEAAERRAEGATRRAALEIEQERQSRASADKRAATAQSRLEAVHAELAEEKARGATSVEQLTSQLRLANRELELVRTSGAAEAGRVGELESQLAEAVSRADRAEAESGLAKTVLARLDIKRPKRQAPARSRAQGAA